MNRDEMYSNLLQSLAQANEAIQIGIETLKTNSETISELADQWLSETTSVEHSPFDIGGIDWATIEEPEIKEVRIKDTPEATDADDIDSLVDRIVAKIKYSEEECTGEAVRLVEIAIDSEKFDPFEVMDKVQQKMMYGDSGTKELEAKEAPNDDYNFKDLQ